MTFAARLRTSVAGNPACAKRVVCIEGGAPGDVLEPWHWRCKMAPLRKFIPLIAAAMLGLLAACNTMEGLGQDIEAGGENLQDSAQDTKKKM